MMVTVAVLVFVEGDWWSNAAATVKVFVMVGRGGLPSLAGHLDGFV